VDFLDRLYRARKRYADRGIAAIHRRNPDRDYERKLDGDEEARLIKLACSDPPEGYSQWSLRLLADEIVVLEEIDHEPISHETVRQVLKKNELQPHRSDQWVIPPEEDAEFVYHMEDVLALYHEPYDPNQPVVCFDEHPTELTKEVLAPLPAAPGRVAREDYQYKPNGTKNLFLASEPLAGQRVVTVTDRRTKRDWVTFIRHLVDEHYPDADCIRVVLDNLNTHDPIAFNEFFEPAEAHRLLNKLEFHFTPIHGSWLNMAEIEFNALSQQCLDQRIPDAATLQTEVAAWEEHRNTATATIDWQFTTDNAQTKLERLYPSFDD